MKFRQMLLSLIGFALVVSAGSSGRRPAGARQFTPLLLGGDGIASWDNRLSDLGGAGSALRYQSIENGPLMVFAVVGAVLFLFMVRT